MTVPPPSESATFVELLFLAVVQGLTEFLPVSSDGHLVLAQTSLGIEHANLAVDVALHLGTLVSVLIAYRKDLLALARELLAGRGQEVLYLAVATAPAAIVGLGARAQLERAFGDPRAAAWGLLGTAAVLLVGEGARRRRASVPGTPPAHVALSLPKALAIGIAQAAAIWPGFSRSGSTIAVGMLLGLAPQAAARFSFLLSIPAILGAALLSLPEAHAQGALGPLDELLWAMALAGLVGWGALRLVINFVGRGAFGWFAAYCAAVGAGYLLLG